MKTQLTNLFSQINSMELKELSSQVKETLALCYNNSHSKMFSLHNYGISKSSIEASIREGDLCKV